MKLSYFGPKRSQEDIDIEFKQILSTFSSELAERVVKVTLRYRLAYAKSIQGNGRALAIKMKCIECVNFEDVQNRVNECSCTGCPLHPHRPFTKGDEATE